MTYRELLDGIPYSGAAPGGEAAGVAQDSRKVTRGTVFVCIEGRGVDGHDFAPAALAAGAGMIVTQRPLGLAHEVQVKDTRAAYAALCHNFFGRPGEKLTLVGVTGTNGKTTVASALKQTLEKLGLRCGLIGTAGCEIGEAHIPAKFTTPEAWDMAALLARMVKAGCRCAVMEASSQALEQGRLLGLHFALGIFTNLSQDHLDYHGDMRHYYEAKKILFAQCDAALINMDDNAGRRLLDEAESPVKQSYSVQKNAADYTAHGVELRADGVRFAFLAQGELVPVRFPIPGAYSAENALAVAAAGVMLGQPAQAVGKALSEIQGVPGRCEVLYSGEFTVIRDFAHTADGLRQLLSAMRPYAEKRLVVLFGCAGDRDAEKRPAMGAAVAAVADEIYITADNPRTEDVQKTINDAIAPILESGKPYMAEPKREVALRLALDSLHQHDMLLLCGKGHEDYQVLDGVTVYFNERELVQAWLREKALV